LTKLLVASFFVIGKGTGNGTRKVPTGSRLYSRRNFLRP
jgi:hypothetical protein